jgi:hypothetical protein
MRRLIVALVAATAGILLVLPATTARATTIGPEITWSGVTVSATSKACQIASQTVTFKVTGLTGNPTAAWKVTAFGETKGVLDVTLPLGTVTRADNGVTESVRVGPGSGTPASWPQGPVWFYVHLYDPSGHVVVTAGSTTTQDCT